MFRKILSTTCNRKSQGWVEIRRWLIAGQPIHETHPEILGPGELAPGISLSEFAERRRALAKSMPTGSVAVIPSADPISVAGIKSPYRQDANFLYLTGISQQAVAVIKQIGSPSSDPGDHAFILFVPTSSERDQWDGARVDCEGGLQYFGAHETFPMSMLSRQLAWLVKDAPTVLFDTNPNSTPPEPNGIISEVKSMLNARATGRIQPLKPYVHSKRWQKSPNEIQLMKRSAEIAASAVRRCIEMTAPGGSEHFLAASFEYVSKMKGAQRVAYPPISASGADNCTVHYSRNDKVLKDGDLVLMDAGCELFGYVSDVTRTWPVSGRFSGAQQDLYEVVLSTHRTVLESCRPGVSIKQLHNLSIRLLSEGLADLGVGGLSARALINGQYRKYYPHMIGHFLGLDVHDTTCVPRDMPLQSGTVLAIEPGLYIPDETQFGWFRGLGIRIEDDVLITDNGAIVLSSGVPTNIKDIENIVGLGANVHQEDISLACSSL